MMLQPFRPYRIYCLNVVNTLISIVLILLPFNAFSVTESDDVKSTFLISVHEPESSKLFKWMQLIYSDLFARLNISIDLEYFPPARSTEYARVGKIDGQAGRMRTYSNLVENQVLVPESLYQIEMTAYVTKSSGLDKLNNWSSLSGKGLKVEYLRGISIASNNLHLVIPFSELTTVARTEQGLEKLKAGRTDVFIVSNHMAMPYLESQKYSVYIRKGGILASVGFYPHLHIRHKKLAQPMARIIKDMKADGSIERYRQQAFK